MRNQRWELLIVTRRLWTGFGLAVALSLACSSNSDDGGPRIPADIVLIPNQPHIPQGLALKLNATVVDASGRAINNQTVTFSSSDQNTVTVDPDGTMHAVGPLGTAQVTADLNGLTNSVDVEITQRVVGLVVAPESLLINPTLGGQLSVSMVDFVGNPVSANLATFQTDNPQVAAVDQFGFVLAGANPGRTIVSVHADTFHVDVPIRVEQIPNTLTTDPISIVLTQGGNRQLTVTVRDLADHPILNPVVTYLSDAPSTFSVNGTGLVASVGGTGGGHIHVTAGELTKDVDVYVTDGTIPVALVHTTQAGLALYQAAIGPAGQVVVTAPADNRAVRGTLPAYTLPTTYTTTDTPFGVAINHAGTRAYVCERDKLSIFDLSNNSALTPIPIQGGGTKVAVTISADDSKAYVGGQDRIYVVDLVAGAVVDSMAAEVGGAFFLTLHPNGQKLYASEGSVREIDLTTGGLLRTFAGTFSPKELAIAPDGSELFVADEGASAMRVINLTSGTITQTVQSRGGAFGMVASSKVIAVASGNVVTLLDRVSRVVINEIEVGGFARRPAISADGKTIVVPNEGGWLDFIQ